MKRNWMKFSALSALALTLVMFGCENVAERSGALVGPEQAAYAKGGVKRFRKLDLANPAPMTVTAEVGSSGAVLQAGKYFLSVPAGAVKGNTTFTMNVGTDGVVSLTAMETRSDGTRVDVGVTGFRKRLTLALYYGNASGAITDATRLQVGWVQSNGSLSAVQGSVDTQLKLVYGELQHFSAYAIIFPDYSGSHPRSLSNEETSM